MDKINGIATLVSMGLSTGTVLVTGIVAAIHMFAGLMGHALTEQEMAHGMVMPSCHRHRDSDFKQGAFMTIA